MLEAKRHTFAITTEYLHERYICPKRGSNMSKIMLVDDAPADLKMMESILKQANHQVITCLNGEGAEEMITSEKPDLLMLDIVMPQRNGYEILRKVRRDPASRDLPVIVVSSKGQESDILWGKRQGASDYIVKPYTPERVLEAVGGVL